MSSEISFDAILPAGRAAKAEQLGVKEAGLPMLHMLVLAILAGAFISTGAILATTVSAARISGWLCYGPRSTTDKILSIIPPIAALVAAGFEHCIANRYFIPIGLFVTHFGDAPFFETIAKTAEAFPSPTWGNVFVKRLVPATLGNLLGRAGLVGLGYWFAYLRRAPAKPAAPATP